jgi:hypothetical protein
MTDNNKYIPKLPETKTEMVLNQEQNQPQTEQKSTTQKATETVANVVSSAREAVIPTVHASDDEKAKEGVKQAVGAELAATDAIAPPVGIIASGVSAIGGSFAEGVGKATDNKDLQEVGEMYKEAPVQPIKEVGKAVEKVTEPDKSK